MDKLISMTANPIICAKMFSKTTIFATTEWGNELSFIIAKFRTDFRKLAEKENIVGFFYIHFETSTILLFSLTKAEP